jgi:hypothetical protein
LQDDITSDYNEYEHQMLSMAISLTPNTRIAGVGFTITAWSQIILNGSFTVHWSWY